MTAEYSRDGADGGTASSAAPQSLAMPNHPDSAENSRGATRDVSNLSIPMTTPISCAESVRPKLLDMFCCAGGAARGYQQAGFHVTGIDINPQPRYAGDEFFQVDAMALDVDYLRQFDAIHASPPCQFYTPLRALHPHIERADFVAAVRAVLMVAGRPWVIENVMSAPLLKERSIVLCGGMFGLRTYRHRRFESSFPLTAPPHPKHVKLTATKQRKARWADGWHVSITGDVGTYVGPEAMGIDWMSGNELCEAIPPAYTRFIGEQLLAHLAQQRLAA
jgi:DNA (cytosine-5)-methyltransferase 1